MKNGNFVAKFDHLVNKAKTFKDRKKAFKKGYMKHKNKFKNFKGDYVPFMLFFPLRCRSRFFPWLRFWLLDLLF